MYSWTMKPDIEKEWNDDALIVPSNESEVFKSHGNKLIVIVSTSVTNYQYGLYDIEMDANAKGPKLHDHKLMEETFIVREGTLTVLTAKGELQAEAGTVIHIPKLSIHGYNNDSDRIVKMTMIFNPGLDGEDFFRKMYKKLEESPNDLIAFQKLYLENDSYSVNSDDMIPMSIGK